MPDEQLHWVDVDGAAHDLLTSATDVEVEWGVSGRHMPPVKLFEEEVPGQHGSRFREARFGPRDIALPITVKGSTPADLRAKVRAWATRFDPTRGAGTLRATDTEGMQRQVTCRYAYGMEGQEVAENGLLWQRQVVVFRANDPFWLDTSPISDTWTVGEPATFFPFFPLTLSSSEVFADVSVNNDGDVETWPSWTIVGPGSGLVLRNLTTGKVLSLTATLAAGDTVTIDTAPGVKTVVDAAGANLYSGLSSISSLWSLARGANRVHVELTGASADSSVTMQYQRRWLVV